MLDKGTQIYIVRETGQPDRVFNTKDEALRAYAEPLIGAEKVGILATVQRVKVQVITEQEQ